MLTSRLGLTMPQSIMARADGAIQQEPDRAVPKPCPAQAHS